MASRRPFVSLLTMIILLTAMGLGSCVKNDEPMPAAVFPPAFKQANDGNYTITTPLSFELANIVLCLHDGDAQVPLINKGTDYYLEVIALFEPYNQMEIFSMLDLPTEDTSAAWSFIENSYKYEWNNGILENKNIYHQIRTPDLFSPYKPDITDFMIAANVWQFYQEKSFYYGSEAQRYETVIPTEDLWSWLETGYSAHMNSYQIILSPLLSGPVKTVRYRTSDFNLSLIFTPSVPVALNSSDSTKVVLHQLSSATAMILDYTHPLTTANGELIDHAFSRNAVWINSTESNISYNTPQRLFDLYMSTAVYLWFVSAHYDAAVAQSMSSVVTEYMTTEMGCPQFEAFSNKLLFISEQGITPEKSYPLMIQWAAEVNDN